MKGQKGDQNDNNQCKNQKSGKQDNSKVQRIQKAAGNREDVCGTVRDGSYNPDVCRKYDRFEYNGEAVKNSRFVYQAYEMPESDNVEYNMYIS